MVRSGADGGNRNAVYPHGYATSGEASADESVLNTISTREFVSLLFERVPADERETTALTLTIIHPDKNHRKRIENRHVRLSDDDAITKKLESLKWMNRKAGYGGFISIATCHATLKDTSRGEIHHLVHLPALFVDVDGTQPSPPVLDTLENLLKPPSLVVASGGGWHGYWLLDTPMRDMKLAGRLLRMLGDQFGGDPFAPTQPLRLPGTMNTKPERDGFMSGIVSYHPERRYAQEAFTHHLETEKRWITKPQEIARTIARNTSGNGTRYDPINPDLLREVEERLIGNYTGRYKRNGWMSALCPCGHERDFPGHHFNYNPDLGLGHCFGRHQTILMKDLCRHLGISLMDYGNTIYLRRIPSAQSATMFLPGIRHQTPTVEYR